MSYVDVIYDASCGIQLFCGIALISANRLNKKRRILCMLLVMFMYIFIDSVMVYGGDLIGSMVAVMEMLMFPIMAFYMTEGRKWVNTIFALVSIMMTNVGWSIFCMLIPQVHRSYNNILVRKSEELIDVIVILCVNVICISLNCYMLRHIKNKIKLINDRNSKTIFMMLVFVSVISYIYKFAVTASEEYKKNNYILVNTHIIINIFLFVVLIIIFLKIYEKSILKDKEVYIENRDKYKDYYENLVNTNLKLMQVKAEYNNNIYSVEELGRVQYREYVEELKEKLSIASGFSMSGLLILDAVIADFYEKAKKHDIVIESSIAPLTKDERDIQEIIGAISDVLDKALSYSVKAKAPRWINIAIRRKNKMLAINVEFSKKTGSYLSRDNYEFKYLRAFVDKASGALLVTNKKEMAQISIII